MRRSKGFNTLHYRTNFLTYSINPNTGGGKRGKFLSQYQGCGSISYVSFGGSSNHHAMQITPNRRFCTGLTIGGNWVWSKAMNYAQGVSCDDARN
jgi:hypothetical protein